MTLGFLTPAILFGGLLVAVPVIIHLIMRRQPKHLLFPAFRFLQLKHRTNVQKLRLRHLLLLVMRVLLILLICSALARPELSGGDGALAIDSPVGVVLILDTSASMDYEHSGQTRLAEAKSSATEFLEHLPAGSQVAVLDTAEPGAAFSGVREAVKRVQARQTRPQNRPVTSSLEEAYRLLDSEAPPGLPMIVCVFSDRTAASWNSAMVSNYLLPLKNRVDNKLGRPLPGIYFDVSAPEVHNVAVTGLSLKFPGGDAGIPLEKLTFGAAAKETIQFQAAVQVTGTNIDSQLVLSIDDKVEDTKRLKLEAAAGQTNQTIITFRPLPRSAKAYQGTVRLKSSDLLEADNTRYWTIAVPERKVLIIADNEDDPAMWRAALEHLPVPLQCEIVTPAKIPQSLHAEQYQVVCLFDVAKPDKELWEVLEHFVTDGGGLVVLPGENSNPPDYRTEAAQSVMPAQLEEIRTQKPPDPAAFLTPDFSHPITEYFKSREKRDLSHWKAAKFWRVKPLEGSRVVSPYNVDNLPAVVERIFDPQKVRGRVVMFTTAMYRRDGPGWRDWNNYPEGIEGWFYLGLADAAIRYVLGAREEQQNALLGDDIRFWLPRGPGFSTYLLSGPAPGTGKVEPGQTQLAIREAVRPGNYRVSGDNWQKVFSLNLPLLETQLTADRPEASEIALLFGEEAVVKLSETPNVSELVRSKLGQSPKSELLPFLMIGVLFLLAGENLLANRFYRREPEQT